MKNYKPTLILLLLLVAMAIQAHPIKMSTAKLQITTKDSVARLMINFFKDDFESEIRKMYPQPPFNLVEPWEDMYPSIEEYIQKNVDISPDGKETSLQLVSVEEGMENVYVVNLQVIANGAWDFSSLNISNTLLFSSFDKQSNVLHVYINDEKPKILQFYPHRPADRIAHE